MIRVFGYQSKMMRWLVPFNFTIFSLVAIGLLIAAAAGSGPPLPFTIAWVAIMVWNGYWFLLQFGHTVEVRGDTVRWRSVLRSREVALADLVGNGSVWMGFEQLRVRDAPSLKVMANDRSWLRFLDELNAVHPGQPFQPTASNRVVARMPTSGMVTGYFERWE